MLRNTGDEGPGRQPDTASLDRLPAPGPNDSALVRALLAEMHVMEEQLIAGSERLETGASHIDGLQLLIDGLRTEAAHANSQLELVAGRVAALEIERDLAVESLRETQDISERRNAQAVELAFHTQQLQLSLATLESAFDKVAEDRDNNAAEARLAREDLAAWLIECEGLLQQSQSHTDALRELGHQRDDLASEVENIRQALAAADFDRNEATREIAELSSKLDVERANRADFAEALEQWQAIAGSSQARIANMEAVHDGLIIERTVLMRRAAEFEAAVRALSDAAQLTQVRFTRSQAHVQDLESHITAAEERIRQLLESNSEKARQIAERVARIEQLDRGVQVEREARAQITARLSEVERSAEAARLRVSELEAALSDKVGQIVERDARVQRLESHIADVEAKRLEILNDRDLARQRANELEIAISALVQAADAAESRFNHSRDRVAELEACITASDERISALATHVEEVSQQLSSAISRRDASQSEIGKLTDAKRILEGDVESLRSDLQAERATRDELAEALSRAHCADDTARARIAQFEREISEVILQRESLKRRSAKLEKTVRLLETDIQSERETREALAARLADSECAAEARFADLEFTHGQLMGLIGELQNQASTVKAELERAAERISVLSVEMDGKSRLIHEGEQRINALEAELQTERATQESLVTALRGAEHSSQSAAGRIRELSVGRDVLIRERDNLQQHVHDLQGVIAGLKEAVAAAESRFSTSQTRVDDLETEIQVEQSAQNALVSALTEVERAARSTEARIIDILSSRSEIVRARDHLQRRVTELDGAVAALKDTVWKNEHHLDESMTRIGALQSELADGRRQLQALTAETNSQSSLIADLTAQAQFLQVELQTERAVHDGLIAALQGAEVAARSTEARVAHFASENRTIVQQRDRLRLDSQRLERTVLQLESRIVDGEGYVGSLLAQIQQKTSQISAGSSYARRLELELSESRTELEAIRKAALADKLVMRDYITSLQEQLAPIPALREAQQHLAAQTESFIASAQAESAQLTTLIDTVQASHFWRLKRLLNRVASRVLRR